MENLYFSLRWNIMKKKKGARIMTQVLNVNFRLDEDVKVCIV